jgi:hypothetical protein
MLVDKLDSTLFSLLFVGLHIPHLQRVSFDDMGFFFVFCGCGVGGLGSK